jgi:hypothetical protein
VFLVKTPITTELNSPPDIVYPNPINGATQ